MNVKFDRNENFKQMNEKIDGIKEDNKQTNEKNRQYEGRVPTNK